MMQTSTTIRNFIAFVGFIGCASGSTLTGNFRSSWTSTDFPTISFQLANGTHTLGGTVTAAGLPYISFLSGTVASPTPGTMTFSLPLADYVVALWSFDGNIHPSISSQPTTPAYIITLAFDVSPWSGGTVVNNNNPNVALWNYTLTGGQSSVAVTVQVRDRATGTCVWCESFSGNGLVNGLQQLQGGAGGNVSQVAFTGTTIPEPSSIALATIALVSFFAARLSRK